MIQIFFLYIKKKRNAATKNYNRKDIFPKIILHIILSNFCLPSKKTKVEEWHWHQLNWAKSKADPEWAEPTELRSEQVQTCLPAGQDPVSGHPSCDCSWLIEPASHSQWYLA